MRSKKKKMNHGSFNGEVYAKYVDLNKAVLWKDRQLSIPVYVITGIDLYKTKELRFIDRGKREMWIFKSDKVMQSGEWKQVGQERQFYFPIELAKKKELQEERI